MAELIVNVYIIGAITAFFGFFISCFDVIAENKKIGGRNYGILDHSMICLAVAVTWPWAIFVLLVKGVGGGRDNF